MMQAADMFRTHPRQSQVEISVLAKCVDECYACAQTCTACAECNPLGVASTTQSASLRSSRSASEACARAGPALDRVQHRRVDVAHVDQFGVGGVSRQRLEVIRGDATAAHEGSGTSARAKPITHPQISWSLNRNAGKGSGGTPTGRSAMRWCLSRSGHRPRPRPSGRRLSVAASDTDPRGATSGA